jgi:hypothetical protein
MRAWLLLLLSASCGSAARNPLGGPCAADGDCQVSLVCVADDPGGQCVKTCASDADCGAGALCNDELKCYQACTRTADCPRAVSDARYGCVGPAPRQFCDVLGEASDGGADDLLAPRG